MKTHAKANSEEKNRTATYLWQIICYKPLLFGGLLAAYVGQYCIAMVPVLIARWIVDSLTGQARLQVNLEIFFLLWVISELLRMGLFTLIILLEINYYHYFWALVRANLFERILSRPGAQALPGSSGEAISRFRDDVGQIQNFMSMIYNAVATGAFTLIAIGIMLTINVRMTLVVFLPMVLVTMLVNQARKRIVAYREKVQIATGQITGALGEMFGAVQAIQANQAEERIIKRFNTLSQARGSLALRDSLFSEMLLSITRNTTNFGTGIILLLGADSMRLGQFTVGDFVLFTFYLGWVTNFTANFGQALAAYRQVGVSFVRLEQLMQSEPESLVKHRPVYLQQSLPALPEPAPAMEPFRMLEVENLTYCYPNSKRGIEGVSFRLQAGEIVAVTGQIGAGKTTLLRALMGLLPEVSGTIRWNGVAITDPGAFFVPPHTAYTPQVPHLFSDTLCENLRMGLSGGEINEAIHAAAMESDLAMMAEGLDTRIGARGMRLSGGQLLRTAVARMYLREPQLLVIDDLSSALDVDTESILWERLLARREVSLLIVSHRPALLHRATHVLWMEEGRVLASGKWSTLSALQGSSNRESD